MSRPEPCNCDQSLELQAQVEEMKKDIKFLIEELNLEGNLQDPIRLHQLRKKYNEQTNS